MSADDALLRARCRLSEYERACSKADEAQAALNERDRLLRSGQNAAKVPQPHPRALSHSRRGVLFCAGARTIFFLDHSVRSDITRTHTVSA